MSNGFIHTVKSLFGRKRTRPKVLIHIGTHKTGTTSIQQYLDDHAAKLARLGVGVYRGLLHRQNHVELHLVSQRRERGSWHKYQHPELDLDDLAVRTKQHISKFLANRRFHTFVFSAEGLSLLRYADETATLKGLFPPHVEIKILVYLRAKEDYLASYAQQLADGGVPFSDDPDAFNYVQPDSWLLDYDALIAAYEANFSAVRALEFEAELEESNGNVIGSFLAQLAIPKSALPNYESYRLNRRSISHG